MSVEEEDDVDDVDLSEDDEDVDDLSEEDDFSEDDFSEVDELAVVAVVDFDSERLSLR